VCYNRGAFWKKASLRLRQSNCGIEFEFEGPMHSHPALPLLLCADQALNSTDQQKLMYACLIPSSKNMERRIMKQKLKTHKAMAKRVKITGSGKFMRRKVALNHLRRNKSPRAIRAMDKYFQLAPSDTRHMKRLLPYGD